VSHNPVGQTIGGALEAGLTGGGIPGVALAVISGAIRAFGSSRPRQVVDPVRIALLVRYRAQLRPHIQAIGRAFVDAINTDGSGRTLRNDATQWIRSGVSIIDSSFAPLSHHEATTIVEALESGRLEVIGGQVVLSPTLLVPAPAPAPASDLPANLGPPSTKPGGKPMVERIDRGNFMEGLGNELVTKKIPPQELSSIVVPTLDLSRFLSVEQVVDSGIQFLSPATVLASTNKNVIRIPGRTNGETIFIRRGFLSVSPSGGAGVPFYSVRGSATNAGANTIVKKLHFEAIRRTVSMTVGDAIVERELGEFSIPSGLDYLIRLENGAGATVTVTANVEAFYLKKGVNGSKC